MSYQWRSNTFTGAGPQVSWPGSSFGSAPYGEICGWLTGETLVRVVLQGQVTFALSDTDPTHVASGWYTAGAQRITFATWANKFQDTTSFPAPIPQGGRDPYFPTYDQMVLKDLSQFHDQLGSDDWTATYEFAGGKVDADNKRGPAQHDNFVWLTWDFFNPLFNPPVNGGGSLATFFGYAITASCLFHIP